jgi:PAS domain S-box-containing protein
MKPLLTALRLPGPRLAQGPAVQTLVRACAVLAFATLAGPWLASGFTTTVRWGMFGCLLAMALPLLPAALSRDERVQGWAMVASMAGTVLGLAGMSYFSRVGVHSVTLQSISVTVLAAGVLLHPVYAWALAALAIAAIAALAVVVPGLPDAVPFPLQASVANRVIAHTLGLALAVGIAHMLHAVLRQNERRMAGLLRIAARVYWELDAQQRLTCLSASEATPIPNARSWHGLHWSDLPGVQIAPQVAARLRERLQARQPFSDLHVRMDLGPHGLRDVSWSGEPRFDALGRFRGFWGVARDVTEQVEAQRQVAASEVRYRELFHNCPLPLVLHRAGTVLDANPAAVALFGHADPAAMQGRNIYHQYVDEDGSVQRGMARALQLLASEPGTMLPQTHFRIHGAGGQVRCVRATGTRMNVADGPAVLSFFVDDTEQQAAEARLAQQQRLLEHLIDACPDSISLSEIDTGRYVMINQAFTRMTGYTAAQAIGRSGMELGLWVNVEDRMRVVAQVRREGRIEHFRTQSRRSNGEQFMLALSGAAFTEDGHEYLVGVGRDTTESDRTRLEHEAILHRASIGIAYTRDQRFFHANAQWEQMFGWGPGELLDQAGRVIWPDDETYAAAGQVFSPALSQGRSVEQEGPMRRRDGSTFWCRLRGQVLDAGNTKAGTIWIAEDVTERRRVEQALAAARDAAEAASRAKSAFLANMSHEIRTPLNGLMGLARLAQHDEVPVPRKQEYLRQIVDSAQCLSDVLSDILDLSKVEAGKLSIENVTGHRRRRAALAARRPGAGAPDRHQLRDQRAQVHACRLRARARPLGPGRRGVPGGGGQRHGHRRGHAGAPVPPVHAGRRIDHAALRRHRPGLVHLPPAGAADGRRGGREQPARPRQPLLGGTAAAAGRGRARGARGAAAGRAAAGRRAPAGGRGQPGQHDDRRGDAGAMGRPGGTGRRRPRRGGSRGTGGAPGPPVRRRADGRADARDGRPRGHRAAAAALVGRRAAGAGAHRRGAGGRARRRAGGGDERVPDEADRAGPAAGGAAAVVRCRAGLTSLPAAQDQALSPLPSPCAGPPAAAAPWAAPRRSGSA